MSCYNVQLIEYPSGYQLRVYNKAINYSDHVEIGIKGSAPKSLELEQDTVSDPDRSLASSINRTVNTIYEYARSNVWSYFLTLTIDPKKMDNSVENYDNFSKSIRKYFNHLKERYAPDLKYLIVPELHKDGKKFHFHALVSDVGNIQFTFSGKVSVGRYTYSIDRCPWGRKIYHMPLWKYGWSTATKVEDSAKCSGYLCKYITKDLCSMTKGKRRFWASHNLEKARTRFSLVSPELLKEFIEVYSNSILYSKNITVQDAMLSIDYYEFDNLTDMSFFEDKIPFLQLLLEEEKERTEQIENNMESLKELKEEMRKAIASVPKGFKYDHTNLGRHVFPDQTD